MASGPNTSWQIDGETMVTVSDFIYLGFKITADGDYSHEIKRRLLLGRKVMSNLDSIFKIRDITLPRKVHLLKAMVFPVVTYGCKSWTIKKAERWRIDTFNCGVAEDSWESLRLQGDQNSQSSRKSILNIHWKDWCWSRGTLPLLAGRNPLTSFSCSHGSSLTRSQRATASLDAMSEGQTLIGQCKEPCKNLQDNP